MIYELKFSYYEDNSENNDEIIIAVYSSYKKAEIGKDVILQKKQVGVDENGNPVLNEYAICKDCKKQWNLDKQRAKKSAPKPAASVAKHTEAAPKQEAPKAPVEKTEETKATEQSHTGPLQNVHFPQESIM